MGLASAFHPLRTVAWQLLLAREAATAMSLIDVVLSALDLPWPSKDERSRRYERIGCIVALVVSAIVGVIVAIASFGGR